jgi:hypothetical protein
MADYKVVNLRDTLESIGEDSTNTVLSSYSCPLNDDIEQFLKQKAIEFERQGIAGTYSVSVPLIGRLGKNRADGGVSRR